MTALARQIGYILQKSTDRSETAFIRPLMGGEFPRFHLYVAEEGENFILNLHLDQKQSKYAGSAAHGGEYDGELVEQEAARINNSLIRAESARTVSSPEKTKKENSSLAAIFKKMFGN